MTMDVLPSSSEITSVAADTTTSTPPSCMKFSEHPICIGCGNPIQDQFLMKVHPNMQWHARCLQCTECSIYLDESCTCFVKDGKTYCKTDYTRLFGTQCAKCRTSFNKSDLVMRAGSAIYHIDCFCCTACSRRLAPGDEFALRDEALFCKDDSAILHRTEQERIAQLSNNNNNNSGSMHKLDNFTQPTRDDNHSSGGKSKRVKEGKTTRVRTVLNEKQLSTLRSCYGANPRPDAFLKEQMVEMTGLSPRVIRVWFQNKRCKDKKKSILLKQIQQQEKGLANHMPGVQMVAQSPMNHENTLQTIDSYHHQTWKRMNVDYGSMHHHDEINHNSFQSLMGSVYNTDDSVYLNEEDYVDCAQPGSVSSQFSGVSTSPHSSG